MTGGRSGTAHAAGRGRQIELYATSGDPAPVGRAARRAPLPPAGRTTTVLGPVTPGGGGLDGAIPVTRTDEVAQCPRESITAQPKRTAAT
ncbi:hypothetical protein GCM10018793_47400 [Streptomyces sulfonofaciens]|uniref:Uncharacterized protein n=1 Tax=Streptomyces sulfonofaciens TaxID=68272 RepID=A0A919GGL7_9ACTN|nr:hypothetical protein GCM10018793_47400 [Streptomyces sulfonofaciens]